MLFPTSPWGRLLDMDFGHVVALWLEQPLLAWHWWGDAAMSPSSAATLSTHHAALFQGAGTDESVLIEIMATRNNQEIAAINEAYQEGTAWEGHGEHQVLGRDRI